MDDLQSFRTELLTWFRQFQRDLPWRRTRDPYAIWISEIMLQQTRVTAVIPYFHRFLSRFPDVLSLASGPEADLLEHWAGLGYYYRARNLQKAAQAIVKTGAFPTSHAELLALPGVGDYTAAAIASIAFDLPFAVLDGNVFRVLSRLFGDATNIASGAGKKHFAGIADALLDRNHSGAFNQAMMELGATVCLPKAPQCLLCPVAAHCSARLQNRTSELPVKLIDRNSVKQDRTVFWIERAGSILIWRRPEHSRLMPGFWELPEAEHLPSAAIHNGNILGSFKHGITFHDYRFQIVEAEVPDSLGICNWKPLEELSSLPLSTIFRKAMHLVFDQTSPARVKSAVSR